MTIPCLKYATGKAALIRYYLIFNCCAKYEKALILKQSVINAVSKDMQNKYNSGFLIYLMWSVEIPCSVQ